MKSITTQLGAFLLLLCVSWAGTAQAQDATVALPAISAEEGESVQVPIEVDGFDDVGAVTLVINYDSDVVTFDSLESAVRPDFQANSPSDGEVRVVWFDQSGSNPIDLGSGTLANLSFSYSSGAADLTFDEGESEIADSEAVPLSVAYERGRVASTIGEVQLGSISDATPGQTVTIPVSAQGFSSDVGSVSLSIAFNSSVLEFESLTDLSSGLDLQEPEADGGTLNIGGFSTDGVTPDGDIAELEFSYVGGSSPLAFTIDSEVTDANGDDLPTEFADGSVSGPQPSVSLPSLNAITDDTVSVPVQAEDFQNVGAVSLSIQFNGAVLSFVEATDNAFGGDLEADTPDAGVVNLSGFDTAGSDLSGDLVVLRFEATTAGSSPLTFDAANSEITDTGGTPFNVSYASGDVSVTEGLILGDVNGNGSIDVGDATLVLRFAVDDVELSGEQQDAADVDGDGEILAADASLILQRVVGNIDEFPANQSLSVALGTGSPATLELGDASSGGGEGRFIVPVTLSGVDESHTSAQFSLTYSAEKVEVESIQSALPSDWTFTSNVKNGKGVVKVATAGTSAPPEGTIARLSVTTADGSPPAISGEGRVGTQSSQTLSLSPEQGPETLTLSGSSPNPVRSSATISYGLPSNSEVTLEVYNVLGQKVETLVNGAKSAGTHNVDIDASELSSGTYLYRIEAGGVTKTGRMTVVK